MLKLFLLVLFMWESTAEFGCQQIQGALNQIDAGNGEVYGVDAAGKVYTWNGNKFVSITGSLVHVTVGPAGVWGVNTAHNVFRLVSGSWVQVSGSLMQIDAGGAQFVSGTNADGDVCCLNKKEAIPMRNNTGQSWIKMPGNLKRKYCACGLYGCWIVNENNDIYFRTDVVTDSCVGSRWQKIQGHFLMIEVATDGSVYGVDTSGQLYKRDGISCINPMGTTWKEEEATKGKLIKHVAYDLGVLWLIETSGSVLKCNL